MRDGKILINGQWVCAHGQAFEKRDPVNHDLIWTGHEANAEDIESACLAARDTFPAWARLLVTTRVKIIETFAEQLIQHKQQLAETISQETGKPLWESLTEVQSMVAKVAISIRAYYERTGEHHQKIAGGQASLRHRPHGVLAIFGPYNFPGHLPNGHIVPALIAGNTLVFKPSELTPRTAQEVVELWQRSGLPSGVLNLVQGGRTTGEALANSKHIDGLLFTGSAHTGYHLHQQFSGRPDKILALEMGGNNALIIDEVEHLDAVVHLAIQSAFISAGQRCTCSRRILVKEGAIGDAFIARFVEVAKQLNVAAWNSEPAPFMGGVISSHAADQLMHVQQQLIDLGAQPLLKMTRPDPNNALLTAGILEVTAVKNIPDEEYFGPLTKIYRYHDFDEAIELANQTRFGLAVGLVTPNKADFERLLIEARAGIVNWNKPLTGASSAAPFGGVGASGNHRASALYAADYCAWPMASLEEDHVYLPDVLNPGIQL
ncbi:succinylglutamate-semialdehyde dehydrogenase [Acinetobacter sp. B5B]|uniref:succinylglutamate-semialdehyde dehydrogenase n=1 Tax=Acinetobacter baretiae TaxID=2605383 RepID=UPI0018C26B07|nr:succinylglutamate-semialdehyde dehydrogenase [Acinetobacter baretiae]MBF7682663.1 succinylglutamate-semialdehyde dehydrogenase [Acinetobacter baretiae]